MNVLKFKRGVKNWNKTFEVKIISEYTADLEKKIKYVEFYDPDKGLKENVPWHVIESFLLFKTKIPYYNSSGLNVKVEKNAVVISNQRGLRLEIHDDQAKSIYLAAHKMLDEITSDVRKLSKNIK